MEGLSSLGPTAEGDQGDEIEPPPLETMKIY